MNDQLYVCKKRLLNYFNGTDLRLPGFWLSTLVIFVIIAVLHIPYLGEPPFWDEIFGSHNQAIWLAKHHFHVWELNLKEETYGAGGSWIYPTDFIPWVFGVFYALFPPKIVHILCRLLSVFSASVCIVCFLQICQILKVKAILVWLVALLFASFPFWIGQAISAGQEMEIAAFMMLSLLFFMKDRFEIAVIFAIVACSIKITAIPLPISYLLYYSVKLLCSKGKKYKIQVVLSILGILVIPALLHFIRPDSSSSCIPTHISIIPTMCSLIRHCVFYFRDFLCVCFLGGIFFTVFIWKQKAIIKKFDFHQLVFLFTVLGFFAGYFLASQPRCPRYAVIAVFPAAVVMVGCLNQWKVRYWTGFLMFFLIINIGNQYGRFLPEIVPYAHDGSYYERSKEYFSFIFAHKEIIKKIQENGEDIQYICAWPYSQILTVPEFGYVTKPMCGIFTDNAFPELVYDLIKNDYSPPKVLTSKALIAKALRLQYIKLLHPDSFMDFAYEITTGNTFWHNVFDPVLYFWPWCSPNPKYAKAQPLTEYNPNKPIYIIQDIPCHQPFLLPQIIQHERVAIKHSPNGGILIYDVIGLSSQLRKMRKQ